MRIVELGTLWERTPPPLYGGIELVVSHVSDGLVERGHKVVLFATGDSKTKAKLKSVYPKALYRAGYPWSESTLPMLNISTAIRYAVENKFDVIHAHAGTGAQGVGPIFFSEYSPVPMVVTIHGTLSKERLGDDQKRVFKQHKKTNYVSITKFQQRPYPSLNWVANVYNAIDVYSYNFQPKPKDYLLWLGRISPLKGTHLAIHIAKRAKKKLIMAGKIDLAVDGQYWRQKVRPKVDGKNVIYMGEVSQKKKRALMSNALAFLNPITWDEPFGLVVPEANAGGTPVIATDRGPMRELIDHGKTGFVFKEIKDAVSYAHRIAEIDRMRVRKTVEKRFHYDRMVKDYEAVFKMVARKK